MSVSSLFIPNSYILNCGQLFTSNNSPVQSLVSQETLPVPFYYGGTQLANQNCVFKKFSYKGGANPVSYVMIEVPAYGQNQAASFKYEYVFTGQDNLAKYLPINDTDFLVIPVTNNGVIGPGLIRSEATNNRIVVGNTFDGVNFDIGDNHITKATRFVYQSVN